MKTICSMLALVFLVGCSRQDYVTVDAVRDGKWMIDNERMLVPGLGMHLHAAGWDTNTQVFIVSNSHRSDAHTKDTLYVRHPKDWSHAQIRNIMDELNKANVGRWPDYFTGILETAQQPDAGD